MQTADRPVNVQQKRVQVNIEKFLCTSVMGKRRVPRGLSTKNCNIHGHTGKCKDVQNDITFGCDVVVPLRTLDN